MKKNLITLVFTFCVYFAYSQVTRIDTVKTNPITFQRQKGNILIQNSFSYTVGLRVYAIEQYPKILSQTNSGVQHQSFINGALFKYNDNQISYRFSGSVNRENVNFNNECDDCERTQGKLNDYQIRAGFEKSIVYTRIQPFFGAEIGYRNSAFKGNSKAAGSTYSVTPYDVVAEKSGVLIGPMVGLRFNVIDHVTISTEAAFDLFYSYEKQEKTFRDAGRTQTSQSYRRVEFLARPLASFSLQYNFGLNE
jgi:hypothetical protein